MDIDRLKRVNAAVAASSGALLAFAPEASAAYVGASAPWLLRLVGVSTLGYAAHVFASSFRGRQIAAELRWFVAGDAAWVLATVAAFAGGLVTTGRGAVVAVALAAVVGWFGVRYYRAAKPIGRAAVLSPRR